MAKNKVVYNGQTLIDLTDTTATAADVASGKYFYTNAGVRTQGTASGGGSVSMDTKTATASNYPVTLSFTGMKGKPKMFACHSTSQISSSGNTTYYYVTDFIMTGEGTAHGNCFRVGSTRRTQDVTSGYTWSYSGTTLTLTSSASSRSAAPGAFNNTYELTYVY
ncbi:MAG: hypothetical protein IJM21_12640 [Clostridia bacterium]|nr:hypothetical protein [Clostridia bacterium]